MPKYIKVRLEETYQIPDDWEIVKDNDGNMKVKTDDNEYYDFGTIPYKYNELNDEVSTMITANDLDDLEMFGFKLQTQDISISSLEIN